MSAERQNLLFENLLVKGGLYLVGGLLALGFSIGLINEALALAS